MRRTASKLFIGDLLDCKIVTSEGKVIGHVADVQLTPDRGYKVIALIFGRRGWLYRLHVLNPFSTREPQQARPDTVPWDAVESFERTIVKLKPGHEVKRS
jgi:sporulation protein YlmC with PRC-barrel domain